MIIMKVKDDLDNDYVKFKTFTFKLVILKIFNKIILT